MILAAEERLFALVVYSPLQSPLVLCDSRAIHRSGFITGYGPWPASSLNTASLHPSFYPSLRLQSYRITHSFTIHQSSFLPPLHSFHHVYQGPLIHFVYYPPHKRKLSPLGRLYEVLASTQWSMALGLWFGEETSCKTGNQGLQWPNLVPCCCCIT